MFKKLFGFSFPGFETPEELQRLKEYEWDKQQKEIKEEPKFDIIKLRYVGDLETGEWVKEDEINQQQEKDNV